MTWSMSNLCRNVQGCEPHDRVHLENLQLGTLEALQLKSGWFSTVIGCHFVCIMDSRELLPMKSRVQFCLFFSFLVCLFQDLQAESIQAQRSLLLRSGEISGELHIDSHKQRRKDLCPLMPFEARSLTRPLILHWFYFNFPSSTWLAKMISGPSQYAIM